ncbi:hypothetical protein BU24DRAFT_417849 [Aaosphaeria arxii CBS 175.79]|uniref:Uncharacterized protein n=1 Tax=Aaosphaeria arxii CBS 175.79 TaxID=1450172 RepID=A0A6A5YC47_9PLEO|nr:uncharacterized protein BU24DRAFT_417849 [Aaosphaeria arxii CBS 175.79]KAF2022214.1 hypothetical protein BU24DRAFT_417849 [Aaosphaeria arxii CBS 175.79]
MAPFRNRDRSNRSGRGQTEHNVLDGLPINQYREVEVPIGQAPPEDKVNPKDAIWPELPMPRDSHMLPDHAQQLLRAARSGRVFKAPGPPEEDGDDAGEEKEQKELPQGFTVKKWVKVARHLEEPEPEFLAKRRKGLPSQYSTNGNANGFAAPVAPPAPLRETKVKQLDSEGNVTVYKALVPEGQVVEGEVQPTDAPAVVEAAPAAAAPGTVIEGVGVANADGVVVAHGVETPQRRRPPPPKPRKKKAGPGRGRKKVVFVEGQSEQGALAPGAISAIKQEGTSVEPSEGGDTPMADAGDDDEGEDESEEEEGEGGEGGETPAKPATPSKGPEDTEMADAPPIPPPTLDAVPASIPDSVVDVVMETAIPLPDAEPIQELNTLGSDTPKEVTVESIPASASETPITIDTDVVAPPVEPVPEPSAEPAPEPVVEPVSEPLVEPTTTVTPEPPAEPTPEAPSAPAVAAQPTPPPSSVVEPSEAPEPAPAEEPTAVEPEVEKPQASVEKEKSTSPELPLSHSRQNSLTEIPTIPAPETASTEEPAPAERVPTEPLPAEPTTSGPPAAEVPAPEPIPTETATEEAPAVEEPAPDPSPPEVPAVETTATEPIATEPIATEEVATESSTVEAVTKEPTPPESTTLEPPSAEPATASPAAEVAKTEDTVEVPAAPEAAAEAAAETAPEPAKESTPEEPDLLGSLEAHLDKDSAGAS